MHAPEKHNNDSSIRFDIGRLDLCLILLGGLIGMVTVYLLSESILLAVLIGFNCGMGGLTAAIVILRLTLGQDYLQLEYTRTVTHRERFKMLLTLAGSEGISVAWILLTQGKHPVVRFAVIGGFVLFSWVMLLYGWIHSKHTADR